MRAVETDRHVCGETLELEASSQPPTRRGLVALAAAVGAGAAVGALPAPLARAAEHRPGVPSSNRFFDAAGDEEIVTAALELERRTAFAYAALAARGPLDRDERSEVRLLAAQERAHASALSRALDELGETPPADPLRTARVPGLERALAGERTHALIFAAGLADAALALLHDAVAVLENPVLRSTAASVLANEAQHLVVLREALGRTPAPNAFVTGR